MGDAGFESEEYIIPKIKEVDVLKVGHHGSKYSTSKSFIEHIKPKIALISVGKNNYNHPSLKAVNNLKNSKIYQTIINGMIEIDITNKIKIVTKKGNL